MTGEQSTILESVLKATKESVLVVAEDQRVVAANDAANTAFARSNQLNGLQLADVIPDEEITGAFALACTDRQTSDVHLKYVTSTKRRYDVHIAPLELDSPPLAIGFFYDVTQVHRLENIRQEFLSNISHELRTPLTSILAFVETLEEGALEDDEHNRHFLSVIRRNGERMRNLIADILELSQIESGNVSINLTELDLSKLVAEIIVSFSSMAEDRQVTLKNHVRDSTMVRADRKRLEQMLTNLVDNAIRFNRQGGDVTIEYSSNEAKNYIYVVDTGEGIAPNQWSRIFERFYRVDRARSRDVGGTGLGLSIVKHLARLHHGEISVESEISVGTQFTIELPR